MPNYPIALCALVLAAASAATADPDDASWYKRACGGGYGGARLAARGDGSAAGSSGAAGSAGGATSVRDAPAQPQVDALVAAMIAAHGGMAAWSGAKALSFTHVLAFGEPLAAEWFISREVTEIATRRTYHEWPLYGGQLGYDGRTTWTVGWKIDNPPGVNVNAAYEVLALPWLTREPGTRLALVGRRKLPGKATQHWVVRMTFAASRGQSPNKYFELYIDPDTHVLAGVAYDITHGGFLDKIGLPANRRSLGPFTHVFYRHVRVGGSGGLLVPAQYETFDPTGGNAGRHAVYDYALAPSFDGRRVTAPQGAVIDTTKTTR